jgi:hypothetical protein
MKKKTKHQCDLPKGWTRREINGLLDYYDRQSEEEGAAEIQAGGREDETLMEIPWTLVPQVRKLIAQNRTKRLAAKRRRVA